MRFRNSSNNVDHLFFIEYFEPHFGSGRKSIFAGYLGNEVCNVYFLFCIIFLLFNTLRIQYLHEAFHNLGYGNDASFCLWL